MKEINTQEIYDNMGEISIRNAVKCIAVTKLVVEFNMCRYNIEDRPRLKVRKKALLWNISMFYAKL